MFTAADLLQTDSYSTQIDAALDRKIDPEKTDSPTFRQALDEAGVDHAKRYEIVGGMANADASAVGTFVDLLEGRKPVGMKVPTIKQAFRDYLSAKDFPFTFGPAIEVMMRNYIMPQILVTREIFTSIPYSGQRDQVNIRSFGPIQIEEVGRNEPYPEVGPSVVDKAFRMALDIKKYGVKLAIEDELYESDNWGILGFLMRQVMDGFVLHEEQMGMNLLNKMGTTIFNNANPAQSTEKKITSGRAIDGSFNGTITLNDMMAIWAYGNTRGMNYSVLLMHPFAWQMWATDPELREIMVVGSQVTSALNSSKLQGKMAQGFESPFGSQFGYTNQGLGGQNGTQPYYSPNGVTDPFYGKLGISPASKTLSPYWATFNIPPGNAAWPGGLRVIITPYVPWRQDAVSKKYITNLYFIDPTRTGILLNGEGPTTDEWSDTEREVRYIKFKRRFGMFPVYQGRGVAVARNIVIDRNYVFDNVNQRSLGVYDVNSPVSGVTF
jgi:hypothetical protein